MGMTTVPSDLLCRGRQQLSPMKKPIATKDPMQISPFLPCGFLCWQLSAFLPALCCPFPPKLLSPPPPSPPKSDPRICTSSQPWLLWLWRARFSPKSWPISWSGQISALGDKGQSFSVNQPGDSGLRNTFKIPKVRMNGRKVKVSK